MHFLQSSIGQFKQVINLGKDSLRKKDLKQPVQSHYFDNSTLISYHANCYAKGTVSGVDWNYEKRFNSFPPKSAIKSALFNINISHFSKIYSDITPQRKYTILVFWSWMVEGISKSAVSTLQLHIKDNKVENDVEIFLVNIDLF